MSAGKGKESLLQPPRIPDRTSSKRGASSELIKERNDLEDRLRKDSKRLKPQASFTSEFWYARANLSKARLDLIEIKRKISIQDFQYETGIDDEKAWAHTDQARKLLVEKKSTELNQKLYAAQAERLDTDPTDGPKSTRRAFMKMFTTSTLGLGVKNTGAGDRPATEQSKFRDALLKVSNQSLEPGSESIWCPVAGTYYPLGFMRAAHLFAWMHGQEVMTSIFGPENQPELFSPYNGLLLSISAEERLDRGEIVIVPRLSDNPSAKEIQAWQTSEPKEYQIRVLVTDTPAMKTHVTNRKDGLRWAELDKKPVVFQSTFRPRARYLYFRYCVTMLQGSWKPENRSGALSQEIGKPYWGSHGRFMKKAMLLAFVEEMGHQYDELLRGAIEGDDDIPVERDETALFVANQQISESVREKEEGEDSDEEDEDEEDEDEEAEEEEDSDQEGGVEV